MGELETGERGKLCPAIFVLIILFISVFQWCKVLRVIFLQLNNLLKRKISVNQGFRKYGAPVAYKHQVQNKARSV